MTGILQCCVGTSHALRHWVIYVYSGTFRNLPNQQFEGHVWGHWSK